MKKDMNDISAEITGVSRIIVGLSNQLDNNATDTLNVLSLQYALFGVSRYLERIAEDLDEMGV